jgi:hypothetical protein
MAREPVKLNAPVSSAGQVSNRAAYMRPGRDNSGSKALADALGSLGGSLQGINQQVDRYQNAQRQSQLQAAQKAQNEEAARLQLQGIKDAEKGVSARGSYMADSPIFQAAYQESHLETSLNVRLAKEERERNWNEYALDVDNGHNRLQSDLLDLGEELMAGHSPELQAKFYSQYRNWANQKMQTQAEGARLQRLKNIGEDGTNDVMALMTTGAPLEAIMARVEEMNNLAAAGGAENPSSYGANAVMVAAELEGRTDILQALVNDKDHMKTFSSEQRKAIQDKMQSLEREDRAERSYMESQMNKQFAKAKGQIALDAMMQFAENPDAGPQIAKNFKGQMVALAKEDPKNAMAYLNLADSMYDTMIPDPDAAVVEMTAGERVVAQVGAREQLEYLMRNADLENPETAEEITRIIGPVHPDDRNKMVTAAVSSRKLDHPDLTSVEGKSTIEELKIIARQSSEIMKIVGGEATFLEPNNMGVSTFAITLDNEFHKAVRNGDGIETAKRKAFGIAASQAGLYSSISKASSDGRNTAQYVEGLTRIPGLSDLFFDNPHYHRFKADNEQAAKKLLEEQVQLQSMIPSKRVSGEAVE